MYTVQKPEEEKKLIDSTVADFIKQKTRKKRIRKPKKWRNDSSKLFYTLCWHISLNKFHKALNFINSLTLGVADCIEETKIPPGVTKSTLMHGNSFPEVNGHPIPTTPEEMKKENSFIALYHQCKIDQNFVNQEVIGDLAAERYYGNTEYKLMLTNPSADKIVRRSTQMKFRLQEGSGEAFYVIGVGDNGEAIGITQKDMEASLRTLHKMAHTLSAELTIISVSKGRKGEIVKVRVN